ncbi:MAG: hypothetical protein COA43_05555 [Robiginitomaculum sp.]|nr:MAG: hypothetical protein COA43_05555 [Robiginitomaculum sp.]
MTKNVKKSFFLSGAVSVIAFCMAQSTAYAQAQDFDIKGQSMAAALMEFGEQSGTTVAVLPTLVKGKTVHAVKGEMEPKAALAKLLDGSGLHLSETENGAYIIKLAMVQTQKITPRTDQERVVRLAQVDAPIATNTGTRKQVAGASGDGVPVEVTGVIFAEGSGARLKGARIEIEETGQVVSTDDLGRFRLTNVAPGEYTLSVDYLGFAPQSAIITVDGSKEVKQHFTLTGGTEEDAIYVYGSRSARAQALPV